jgi:hypothetical protein
VALLLSAASTCAAETHIAGDIHAMALDETGNPYIVEQDIFVPTGKKATIKEGCVLLFKSFTGLRVEGQLSVEGTTAKPVVFTSINDGDHNPQSEQLPNSFDWNGILIVREAVGASLKNFQLKYSVYGVKAQNSNIEIANGTFYQNGQFHFTVNDKIQYVQDNQLYSYNASSAPQVTAPSGQGTPAATTNAATKEKAPKQATKGKKVLRFACLGVGVAGVAAGATFAALYVSDKSVYDKYSTRVEAGQILTSSEAAEMDKKRNAFPTEGTVSWIAGAVGVLGLVGFGITFAF